MDGAEDKISRLLTLCVGQVTKTHDTFPTVYSRSNLEPVSPVKKKMLIIDKVVLKQASCYKFDLSSDIQEENF